MEPSTGSGTRPSLEVMDIFRLHGEEYKNHYPLSLEQKKAMADITRCRTASLGGHVDVCDQDCGFTRISYNSCRNRHCPKSTSLFSLLGLPAESIPLRNPLQQKTLNPEATP
jgi:hypothetical protein